MQISGITFTTREIDVISCILNARNTKKIATILLISPRTVETHIQNILLKIKGNSQEAIIDFIEKSTEFKFIKEHYLNLLIKTAFEHQLKRISYLAKKCQASCYISYNDQQDYQKDTLQSLIKHLKIAGIELLVNYSNYNNDTQSIKNLNYNYKLHVLSHENIEQIIVDELLQDKQSTIFLIIDNDTKKLTAKKFLHSDIIDFSIKEQYFHNILRILGKLFSGIDCSKFISDFEQYRINIINAKTDIIPELFSSTQSAIIGSTQDHVTIIDPQQDTLLRKISSKRLYFVLGGLVCFIILIIMFFLKINSESRSRQSYITSSEKLKHPEIVSELDDFLSVIKNKDFSADNITEKQMHKNYSIGKQMEKILMQDNKLEIQEYFNNANVLSNELIDYLYNLHALANYYTYNEHDGEKARKILQYAQTLAEHYISERSKISINFDKLNQEEIYNELTIIKDLPEIYTRIIYSLGRTYIYQGDSIEAKKYFELSKYLGNKLGLFEGYLSDISGLGIIKRDEINIDIKNGAYKKAEEKLHESIKLYKKLKNSNIEYKADYKPGVIPSQTIIPKEHIYNQVECGIRITNFYSKLIMITTDISKKTDYVAEIANQFLGTKTSPGILIQSRKLLGKKVAYVYNNLGNILLQLYDESIDFKQFNNKVIKELNLKVSNDLSIIEQIFKFAESQSRNTYYTKADSYDGLIRLYQQKIEKGQLNKEEQNKLSTRIEQLKEKRDYINKKLNRKSYL